MEANTFMPGTNVILDDFNLNINPKHEDVKIKFPARIHMTPFDCNRFDFGKPGGGGYGFSVDSNNFISLKSSDNDEILAQKVQIPVIEHFASIMKQVFGFEGKFRIEINLDDLMVQHSGLGSTAIIACAVVWAFNVMFSQPLTKEQCRKIVTDNFAEGYNMELLRGLETGVGTLLAFKGGFVVVSDRAEEVFSAPMPEDFQVVLVYCECERVDSDLPESEAMFIRSMELDSHYRYYKAFKVLMDLIPSVKANDWKTVGDITWEFQFAGTHVSMIQGYKDSGLAILDTMFKMKKTNPIAVGLSSVGPAIYVICEDSSEVEAVCKANNYKYKVTRCSNTGMVTEHCK